MRYLGSKTGVILKTGLGFVTNPNPVFKTVRSRSLEMAPFGRSHTSSYSPSIVTMAVSLAISEIFSVKEWPDLKICVWGPLRSLKMARFDRSCMTFY